MNIKLAKPDGEAEEVYLPVYNNESSNITEGMAAIWDTAAGARDGWMVTASSAANQEGLVAGFVPKGETIVTKKVGRVLAYGLHTKIPFTGTITAGRQVITTSTRGKVDRDGGSSTTRGPAVILLDNADNTGTCMVHCL